MKSMPIRQRMSVWLWLGPLIYMLIVGLYFTARFGGRWSETDTAELTKIIRGIIESGTLVPPDGRYYSNGFTYQSITVALIAITGLDLVTLQQLFYPLTAALLVLPAWLLYRELVGSPQGATLATILLFSQPEFLFVILRSSHEKFTRALMLLCLYLLARSFRIRESRWSFALYIGLFYLSTLTFIASNNLLAHSFIFAVGLALLLGRLFERRVFQVSSRRSAIYRRLGYALSISLALVYLFTFYIYPVANDSLGVLRTIWDRVAALFLDVQTSSTIAYTQVQAGWISLPVYFFVSIADWLILGASVLIWLRVSFRMFWRREKPATQAAWLIWLLYTAFALQGAISIFADAAGVLGSNLQHRLFPSFAIAAIALVSQSLIGWLSGGSKYLRAAIGATVFCLTLLSVFKATNEPLLSNTWTFYREGEIVAYGWADQHLQNQTVWYDFNERLYTAYGMQQSDSLHGNEFVYDWQLDYIRSYLVTDIVRMRSLRLNMPLPLPYDALQVYDNGTGQVYHTRPLTPYQR